MATITIASVAALSALGASSAGADPYEQASVSLEYAHKSLGVAGELFDAFDKSGLAKASFGFALVASVLAPLFGLGNSGPTIEDVLDKLDQMSEQLDQIKEQLQAIDSKIGQLQAQVEQLTKLVANSACASRIETALDPHVSTINSVKAVYDSMLTTAQTLPTSTDPAATLATLKEDFANLATMAMGPNSNTPAGGPLYSAITGIHSGLMGSPVDPTSGVIYACAEAGLLNFRDGTQDFSDDRAYYAYVTAVVNYYENDELLGLSLLQEAAAYRVTQTLADAHVAIPQQDGQALCAMKQAQAGDPAQICRDASKLTKDAYQDLVAEWALTGRPYSDGNVILQDGSGALGVSGIQPILWVRDPKAEPADGATGTWSTDPNKTISYDGFSGWKPARLEEWENLQKDYGAGRECPAAVDLFACMAKAGFKNVAGTYWMPQQSVSGLKLPVPDPATLGVLGFGGNVYPYTYAGPDLTLRCFVEAETGVPVTDPFACSQSWIDHNASVRDAESTGRHSTAAVYTIKWGFSTSFGGLNPEAFTFLYQTKNPYSGSGSYDFSDKSGSYPAWINQEPYGVFPVFLSPLSIPVVKYCTLKDGDVAYPCGSNPKTFTPKEVTAQLWQTLAVKTTNSSTQRCANTVGVPQLCAPINGAAATTEDQPFESFVNDTIPNPSLPSPTATAAPAIKVVGNTAQCVSGGWQAAPANWSYGRTKALATSWTATSGATSYTAAAGSSSILADNKLDLHAFATAANFDATKPFTLTCTVSARWERLANTGTALSANYQVTPQGSSYVLTQVPDAPTIGTADAGGKSATVHWTVGASHGTGISSFTVTPFAKGVAQAPVTLKAGGPGLSGAEGAKDSTSLEGLIPGTSYTFSVTESVTVPGTAVVVASVPSSLSNPVTPKEVAPLSPLSSTTTTVPPTTTTTTTTVPTVPLTPLESTTTVPFTPIRPTDAFVQTVTKTTADTATATFTPASAQVSVDLHYRIGSGAQQSFRMQAQSDGSYTQLIRDVSGGDTVTYHFTYIPVGTNLAVDSKDFTYTQP